MAKSAAAASLSILWLRFAQRRAPRLPRTRRDRVTIYMSMRRRLIQLGVFLLVGAITNVAVAWGFALSASTSSTGQSAIATLPNGTSWVVDNIEEPGFNQVISDLPGCIFHVGPGLSMGSDPVALIPSWSRIRHPILPTDSAVRLRTSGSIHMLCGPSQLMVDEAVGLPFRSMWCGWGLPQVFAYSATPLTSVTPIVRGVEFSAPDTFGIGNKALPLGILWSGFISNTFFYAVLCFAVPRMIQGVRSRRRIKRGLCPACAYPVGSSDVCTECGGAIPSPLRGRAREGVGLQTQVQCTNDPEVYSPPRPLPVREGESS